MSLSKGIQSAAAAALSAAMLIAVAACGTTDGTDTASKSGDSSKRKVFFSLFCYLCHQI